MSAEAGDGAAQYDLPVGALADFRCNVFRDRGVRFASHKPEHVGGILIAHHIEIGGLTEVDLKSRIEDVVEGGVAGSVVEIGEYDLFTCWSWMMVLPPKK